MKLLEYEAKQILQRYGVPIPRGKLVSDEVNLSLPAVLKSQVPVGGRGKAGGIRVVHSDAEAVDAAATLSTLAIKGFTPRAILAEELLEIDREFYLSLLVNRDESRIDVLAHREGGVEVESNMNLDFLHREITRDSIESLGQVVAETFGLEDKSFVITELLDKLYTCLVDSDATLVEINPLVLTKAGDIVAGDCKMELDDMAAFRHPDWKFEDTTANTNFVVLHKHGHIATIANGAGLAMATVDAVEAAGMLPANFLDIGGGATTESTVAAFREIMNCTDVKAIVINIFAGITRCDQVAQAIVEATQQIPDLPPVFVRLAGTNYEQAVSILDTAGIPLQDSLEKCLELAKEEIHG